MKRDVIVAIIKFPRDTGIKKVLEELGKVEFATIHGIEMLKEEVEEEE